METGQLTATPHRQAQHFYLCLADRDECESIERLLRHRRLAADIEDAARRADAAMRLELALARLGRRAA
jgi:hypothetical protein